MLISNKQHHRKNILYAFLSKCLVLFHITASNLNLNLNDHYVTSQLLVPKAIICITGY